MGIGGSQTTSSSCSSKGSRGASAFCRSTAPISGRGGNGDARKNNKCGAHLWKHEQKANFDVRLPPGKTRAKRLGSHGLGASGRPNLEWCSLRLFRL